MHSTESVTVVRGEEELLRRTAHLFATATEVSCAANDLWTFAWAHGTGELADAAVRPRRTEQRVRKIYRAASLLDPVTANELANRLRRFGADIRVTSDEINETVIIDRRLVILAGDRAAGARSYSVITQPDTVAGVSSLFEAAWRSATDLASYDARIADVRRLAPQVLDLLSQGVKDETAARSLGLGVRTYRRRVAELMAALGAQSRFQAGMRAREIGIV
ncbi:DNA-binding response regulator [Gordonia sp. HNM0687]|uniref:DNA-binding response regulator n=1 Tax=Gordonia mangrovi TaxID=2665643 RepID=A0A6L7GK71_9ACTN|nr:response regulator transcription factor [Gordonia mangrovi]MXP20320.1 DNA-binding response regulator [Gordonia mangrovi]UVF79079.1 response regulator transcription factor [Gordonia mangrovi]